MKVGIASYCDYEDADYGRVSEMRGLITKRGGVIHGERASEEDGEARVIFAVPADKAQELQNESEDVGWEVRWRS